MTTYQCCPSCVSGHTCEKPSDTFRTVLSSPDWRDDHIAQLSAQLRTALADVDGWKRRWNDVQPNGPDLNAVLYTSHVVTELALLRAAVNAMHDMVDLTDPKDPIGVALTRVGLERRQ